MFRLLLYNAVTLLKCFEMDLEAVNFEMTLLICCGEFLFILGRTKG